MGYRIKIGESAKADIERYVSAISEAGVKPGDEEKPLEELPDEVQSIIKEFQALNVRMSAEEPTDEERKIEDLVEIEIPYNDLLLLIYIVQVFTSEQLHATKHMIENIQQMELLLGDSDVLHDMLHAPLYRAAERVVTGLSMGAQFNDIRRAARPIDLGPAVELDAAQQDGWDEALRQLLGEDDGEADADSTD